MVAATCGSPGYYRYRLQIITEQSIFTGEMYLTICVEWASDHSGPALTV